MAPPGDVLPPSALWAEGAAVAEDVLGIGGVCGFQGLSLSEAAVATNKEVRLPVKGRAGNKEEVVNGEAKGGCAVVEVEEAPATGGGIKGEAEAGCAVAGDAVEEAPEEGRRQVELTPYEIEWILDQRPRPISPPEDKEILLKVYPPEMVDRLMEANVRAAEAMAFVQERFFAFQDRVRKDFAETGVVMVDDISLERNEDNEPEQELERMDNDFCDSDFGNFHDDEDENQVVELAVESASS